MIVFTLRFPAVIPPTWFSRGTNFMMAIWTAVLMLLSAAVFAGGVSGVVTNEKGEPLAYTTIFVKEAGTGTVANGRGAYELLLPSGKSARLSS